MDYFCQKKMPYKSAYNLNQSELYAYLTIQKQILLEKCITIIIFGMPVCVHECTCVYILLCVCVYVYAWSRHLHKFNVSCMKPNF